MHKIHPGHNQIRFYQSTIDQKSGAFLLLVFSIWFLAKRCLVVAVGWVLTSLPRTWDATGGQLIRPDPMENKMDSCSCSCCVLVYTLEVGWVGVISSPSSSSCDVPPRGSKDLSDPSVVPSVSFQNPIQPSTWQIFTPTTIENKPSRGRFHLILSHLHQTSNAESGRGTHQTKELKQRTN